MKTVIQVILFLIVSLPVMGQINGRVLDENGEGLPGISVLVSGLNQGASTNVNGAFTIKGLEEGTYSLTFSGVGYLKQVKTVNYKALPLSLNINMKVDTKELENVVVYGKSETSIIKELPFAVHAVDVEPLKTQNLDVNQVLNRTAGVRIREQGGLGSSFNFSLNGFSGNQVKFFMDGIPMDNFGSSLSLNNIPVNLISGIEVYKGVVPIKLGADALGGAINVVTNQTMKNYLDVGYSFGSFNTHRASIVSRYTNEASGYTVNANAFFNYSDNNYSVLVEVPDPDTGAYGDPVQVKRFNDGYQSQTVQLEVGLVNKKYADKLMLGVILSGNRKEVQTGNNMTQVAGEVFTTDKVFIPTLKYKKENLFIKGLTLSAYANYNIRESMVVDTSSRVYNWYGDYTLREIDVRAGELNWDKTEFRFDDRSAMSSTYLTYELGERHSIELNNTFSSYTRVGEDPISYTAVPFSKPNTLTKNIAGVGYNLSLFNNKWKSSVFAKLFYMDALMHQGDGVGGDQTLTDIQSDALEQGYGFATTYFIKEGIQIKASYENTYRLPQAYEMFGNGLLVESNPTLGPEQSQNFNVGALINLHWSKNEIMIDAGYLYRLPNDLIRQVGLGITSQYQNLSKSKSNIYEMAVKYSYNRRFILEVNGSYQDIVNNEKLTSTGGENYLYGDRLPNIPFLFANANVGVNFNSIGFDTGSLSLRWSTAFVEAFFLKWPSQGDPNRKYDIPRQLSHDLSVSYSLQNGKYNMSVSCTNIFDEMLFDDFMLQKPGRAFNLKLRYFLSNNF